MKRTFIVLAMSATVALSTAPQSAQAGGNGGAVARVPKHRTASRVVDELIRADLLLHSNRVRLSKTSVTLVICGIVPQCAFARRDAIHPPSATANIQGGGRIGNGN